MTRRNNRNEGNNAAKQRALTQKTYKTCQKPRQPVVTIATATRNPLKRVTTPQQTAVKLKNQHDQSRKTIQQ